MAEVRYLVLYGNLWVKYTHTTEYWSYYYSMMTRTRFSNLQLLSSPKLKTIVFYSHHCSVCRSLIFIQYYISRLAIERLKYFNREMCNVRLCLMSTHAICRLPNTEVCV